MASQQETVKVIQTRGWFNACECAIMPAFDGEYYVFIEGKREARTTCVGMVHAKDIAWLIEW